MRRVYASEFACAVCVCAVCECKCVGVRREQVRVCRVCACAVCECVYIVNGRAPCASVYELCACD